MIDDCQSIKMITLSQTNQDIIAGVSLFAGLSASEIQAVLACTQQIQREAGTYFYRQGDPAAAFHVLLSGRAKISQVTADGHQILARFVKPGGSFGLIAALENAMYPMSAETVRDCSALIWDQATLAQLLTRYPRLALNGMRQFSQHCQMWQGRYEQVTTQRVEQRIAQTLLRLTQQLGKRDAEGIRIDLPLSREDLAEMTGTTLYTVSRILSRWEQAGWLATGREQVIVRAPHKIVHIAEGIENIT